jgi:hypothetical protein
MTIFDFWLIVFVIAGGIFLGYPLVRALSRAIEERFVGRRTDPDPLGERGVETPLIMRLEARVAELETEQQRLRDQQEFLESLLEEPPKPPALQPPD